MQISATSHLCNSEYKRHTVEIFWKDCYTDLVRTFVIQNCYNQRIVGTSRDAGDPLVQFSPYFHRGQN